MDGIIPSFSVVGWAPSPGWDPHLLTASFLHSLHLHSRAHQHLSGACCRSQQLDISSHRIGAPSSSWRMATIIISLSSRIAQISRGRQRRRRKTGAKKKNQTATGRHGAKGMTTRNTPSAARLHVACIRQQLKTKRRRKNRRRRRNYLPTSVGKAWRGAAATYQALSQLAGSGVIGIGGVGETSIIGGEHRKGRTLPRNTSSPIFCTAPHRTHTARLARWVGTPALRTARAYSLRRAALTPPLCAASSRHPPRALTPPLRAPHRLPHRALVCTALHALRSALDDGRNKPFWS